jgi:hypothetical protein
LEISQDVIETVDIPPECPTAQPVPNSQCTGSATCEWGNECCCGKCYPSFICTCQAGTWACLYSDACLLPPDYCPADVTDTPDVTDVSGDAPPEGKCHSSADCTQSGQYCFAPGDPQPCGICQHPDRTCGVDEDCKDFGQVCDWWDAPCKCTVELACIQPCGVQGGKTCGALEECKEGHCVAKVCVTDQDCPKNFFCPIMDLPHCQRMTCASDAGCPDGYCVNGTCRDEIGYCTYPVP